MKPGARNVVVVAGANVLLAAVAGRAASKVFEAGIEIYATDHNWAEMEKYLPEFSAYYGIPMEDLITSANRSPVLLKDRSFYQAAIKEAKAWMEERDPDDIDVAALAFLLRVPVWSNDNDFKGFPTGRYTTAQLLRRLGY